MILSEIETACEEIRKVLDEKIDRSNAEEVSGKLNTLTNIQGLGAEIISQSERIYNRKAGLIIENLMKYKAGEQKLKLNSECADEIYFLRLSEQYTKEIHYQLEVLRSQLSYLKEERRATQYTN